MDILYFLLTFFLVVNIHEVGHFIFSKLSGVKVEEYGFGWPPRIYAKKIGKTVYSLNALLAGGFVKIFGKDIDEADALASSQSFQRKGYISKISIILGGIFFNIILAFLLFYILFLFGFPRFSGDSSQVYIHSVISGSPADVSGLEVGDKVLELAGERIEKPSDVPDITANNANKSIELIVERKGELLSLQVTPDPKLGISVSSIELQKADVFESAKLAGLETYNTIKQTSSAFYKLLTGKAGEAGIEVSGPVGIAKISGETAKLGWRYFFQFIASLSVNLAILNLIPFPALDGGWLVITSLESLRKRPFKSKYIQLINTIGFIAIIGLLIVVTIKDIL